MVELSNAKEKSKIENLFKCKRCELNFVENDGDLCLFCLHETLGTVAQKKFSGRTSICFNCQNPVDAYVCEICPKCHWFICHECGSCGCDYYGVKE